MAQYFILLIRLKFNKQYTVETCPSWPASLLQVLHNYTQLIPRREADSFRGLTNLSSSKCLSSYAVRSAYIFGAGEYFPASNLGELPHAAGFGFTEPLIDSCPPQLSIGNAEIRILEVYPLSADELTLMQRWDSASFAKVLRRHGLYVCSPQRTCVLQDASHAAAKDEALRIAEEEGARVNTFAFPAGWNTLSQPSLDGAIHCKCTIVLPRVSVATVQAALQYRLQKGKFVHLEGGYLDAHMMKIFECSFYPEDTSEQTVYASLDGSCSLLVRGFRQKIISLAAQLLELLCGARTAPVDLTPRITLCFLVVETIQVHRDGAGVVTGLECIHENDSKQRG